MSRQTCSRVTASLAPRAPMPAGARSPGSSSLVCGMMFSRSPNRFARRRTPCCRRSRRACRRPTAAAGRRNWRARRDSCPGLLTDVSAVGAKLGRPPAPSTALPVVRSIVAVKCLPASTRSSSNSPSADFDVRHRPRPSGRRPNADRASTDRLADRRIRMDRDVGRRGCCRR